MEGRRDHRVLLTLGTAALIVALAATAFAEEHPRWDQPPTVTVDSEPDGVVVESEVRETSQGRAGGGASGSGSGASCELEPIRSIGVALEEEARSRPGELPFMLWCDGDAKGVVWRSLNGEDAAPGGEGEDPRTVAMRLRDEIPIPFVTVEANPSDGLVGMESWFWIEGYDGSPITASADALGAEVEVEARAERYEWSFGDGTTLLTHTPGQPYPERSEVRHTYERSSHGHEEGYEVRVRFEFGVRYRIDGAGWQSLPGIDRTAETSYPVRESQAVIER